MQTTTEKNELIGYLIFVEIKHYKLSKMYILRKRSQKAKKNITILHFMTTLNNVPLKTEIGSELQKCLRPL